MRYLMTICEKGFISLVTLYSVSLRHVTYFMDGLCIQPLILAVIRRGEGDGGRTFHLCCSSRGCKIM